MVRPFNFLTVTSSILFSVANASPAKVASSFGGMSSYFLHAYPEEARLAVLDAMKAAESKVLRIFISYTPANNKNTGSVEMPDIEPKEVGVYDDFQLEAIDQLMLETKARGIKLIIAVHDRYQLGCWGNDTYVPKYSLPAINCGTQSVKLNDVTSWYASASAQADFDMRITHILNHRNSKLGNRRWIHLASHIFSFNIQNEGQGHLNNNIAPVPNWWCDKAILMRKLLGSRNTILVSTGGGNEWTNSDVPENWACPAIDLVGLHSYSGAGSFAQYGPVAIQNAMASNKKVMIEEFGATGAKKAQDIQAHLDVINGQLRIPWAIWQINKPGTGANDFEFFPGEPAYDVVKAEGTKSRKIEAVQDFSKPFYDVGGLELQK